jgi:multiple sugar transport system substrate-binding protein
MTYTPFGAYYFDAFNEQLASINEGSVSGSEAADGLQESVVKYAEEQGFTVE